VHLEGKTRKWGWGGVKAKRIIIMMIDLLEKMARNGFDAWQELDVWMDGYVDAWRSKPTNL